MLFLTTAENPQNGNLARVTLFLIGELSNILLKIKVEKISEKNVLKLIEGIIFKADVDNDIIAYGLTCLLKL